MRLLFESAKRVSSREAISLLCQRIAKHESAVLPVEELSQFGIRFEKLDMDENELNEHAPAFFTLYPRHLLPGLDEAFREYVHDARLAGGDSGHTPFTGLEEFDIADTVFRCFKVGIPTDSACPHVKLELFNTTAPTNDTVLRGELLPLLRIIETQMSRGRFIRHSITPIFVFSIIGLQCRFIEAFFQDETLVVRATELLNFEEENLDHIQLFGQFYMGGHTGVTTEK
ncbi:hypothetical protein BJY00DRAFT_308556 [Aspergillus carlsbadensis]|nr:hypothetical protein BJY00DRAFT_308556 [Aspergillus carlsbadensis]